MRMIFENLLALLDRGEDAVLVTVVSAQGSTPRGTGSQLLANREGLVTGTIGGGPGEAQALALAAELLQEGQSAVRRLELRQLLPADGVDRRGHQRVQLGRHGRRVQILVYREPVVCHCDASSLSFTASSLPHPAGLVNLAPAAGQSRRGGKG